MGDQIVDPSGPWQAGRTELSLDGSFNGRNNIGWGTVTTADQNMAGAVRMYTYKLQTADSVQQDYYSAFGHMSHGVAHGNKDYQPYYPTPNWVSVGYYAPSMSLVLELIGNGSVWDSGPTSTVGSSSTGFNIGGNLGGMVGEINAAQGGVSTAFSASFASPDVRTGHAAVANTLRWDIALPGVGFVSPGVPANPKEPSYAGYKWYFAAIFKVDKGAPFELRVHPRVNWNFDYTRGITNDTKTWENDQTYKHQSV